MVGCVLETTDEIVKDEEEEEEEEGGVKTTVFQTLAEFRDITVWGHEQVPAEEGVLRGVEEWVGWAGRIHGWQEEVEGKA